jgi:hypothetical protein
MVTGVLKNVGDHFVFLNCYLKNFTHGSWWVSGRYPFEYHEKIIKKRAAVFMPCKAQGGRRYHVWPHA